MLYSMTGYGKGENKNEYLKVSVELKTLNSKGIDINLKIPHWLRYLELEIRNILHNTFIRGKIELIIHTEITGELTFKQYNADTIKNYYLQLKQLVQHLDIKENNDYMIASIFREIIHLPDTSKNKEDELLTEENKIFILKVVQEACNQVNSFRKTEGEKLEKDILNQIKTIEQLKIKIAETEPARKIKIKEKILNALKENLDISKINTERFEQEMIYYLEKLDINEELVRLSSHLEYFKNVCKDEVNAGKKLSFITQEIGREINTTGSKANDEAIQKLVIEMKDVLEKMKEQLNNIL